MDWWLVAIFLACSVLAALLVYRAREWSVMTDELLYTEMARGMLATGLPLPNVRGEFVQVYQVLYPLLIAPVVWVVGMPEAYQAIAVVNAVAITSACIPAYLLTNYITDDRVLARWVALCSGLLPWIALATKILTDSLAYPLFVWALYAMVRAVAEGGASRRRDWVALGAIAAAYFARSQFVVLPVVFCAAILGREFAAGLAGGARESVREARHANRGEAIRAAFGAALRAPLDRRPAFVVGVLTVLLVLLRPTWILGIYAAATGNEFGSVVPSDLIGQMGSHLGMIALGVGLLPLLLAAPWIITAIGRPGEPRQNSASMTLAITTLVLLFVAASFDARFSRTEEVYERYVFYLAPILLIGAAAVIKHPPKHWAGFVLPALAALLVFARDDHYGLDEDVTISLSHAFKPVVIFQIALQRVVDAAGFLPSVTSMVAIAGAIGAVAIWFALDRGKARAAGHASFAVIAFVCLWATVFTVPKAVEMQNRAGDARFGLRTGNQKTWVDVEAGDRRVSLIYNSINFADGEPVDVFGGERPAFWDAELWNESIGSYYTPFADRGAVKAAMAPYHRLRVNFADGSIRLTGGDPAPLWLMSGSDPRFAPLPSARPVDEHFSGMRIYPVPKTPRADWATRGLTYYGFIPANGETTLRVYADPKATGSHPATVRMTFERKRRSGAASRFGVRAGRVDNDVVVRTRELCLERGGRDEIDLRRQAAGLIDRRYAARLLTVRIDRATCGC